MNWLRLLLMGMVAYATFSIATTARSETRTSTPMEDTVITDGSTPHTSLKPLPTEEWCRAEIMERADAVLNRTGGNYGVPMFEIDIKHCLITGKPEASVYGD
jgi:hypothetical protein